MILDVNVPVTMSGVAIKPGDLLHGDANGVLTIPLEIAGRVHAECMKVIEAESRAKVFAASPEFTLEGLRKRLNIASPSGAGKK